MKTTQILLNVIIFAAITALAVGYFQNRNQNIILLGMVTTTEEVSLQNRDILKAQDKINKIQSLFNVVISDLVIDKLLPEPKAKDGSTLRVF